MQMQRCAILQHCANGGRLAKGEAGKLEGVSKDDAFRVQKEIEEATEKVISSLNDAFENKQRTIMEVWCPACQ